MFIYYGRRYIASSVGARLDEVACDQCGTKYFYELLRIGSGEGTAPYGIGKGGAERSANAGSKRDLGKRLDGEAELVPCPKCQWINNHLIEGYRRGMYRAALTNAIGVGFVIACVTGIIAGVFSMGPAADRDGIVSILAWGLSISLAIPGFVFGVRHLLRQRIQPNREYPLPPKVPFGTPSALTINPTTGELEPAGQPTKKSEPKSGHVMCYRIGLSSLPAMCCECVMPDSGGSAYRYLFTATIPIVVPLCRRCTRRSTWRKCLGALVGIGSAALGVPVLLVLQTDAIFFGFAIFLLFTLLPVVGAMIASYRTAPVRVRKISTSRGIARLWVRNKNYLNHVGMC
jgi:hypothetical protein